MENTIVNALLVALVWVLAGLFYWKIYPIIKDNEIFKKALQIVHEMEERYGAGTGKKKFDTAVQLLQDFVCKHGWKIDVSLIAGAITSAVGALHAEQGKRPEK